MSNQQSSTAKNRTQTEALQRYTKLRKRAAEMTLSLLNEDYVIVSQSKACETVTLRHRFNGNFIVLKCGNIGVFLYKNGLLKKIEIL